MPNKNFHESVEPFVPMEKPHTNGAAPSAVVVPVPPSLSEETGADTVSSGFPNENSVNGGSRPSAGVRINGGGDSMFADWHQHNLATDNFSEARPIVPHEESFRNRDAEMPVHVEQTPQEFSRLFATVERQVAQIADGALQQSGILGADAPYVLGVTSAAAGEGKTTIALHLALSAARSSMKKVCLIDLSLGEDDLCQRLGVIPPEQGVVNVLEERDQTLTTLKLSGGDDLVIMPAGRPPINAAKLARSARVAELIVAARQNFDIIVVDMPAVSSDNAVPLAAHTDGVLFVTCAGVTPKSVVQRSVDALGRKKVLGVVLNRVRVSAPQWILKRLRL